MWEDGAPLSPQFTKCQKWKGKGRSQKKRYVLYIAENMFCDSDDSDDSYEPSDEESETNDQSDTDNESSNEESDIQPESDDQVGKENEFPEDFEDPMTKLAKKTNFQKTLRTPLVLLFYG
ncbi:hypothetical protein QE152_g37967 [Popillia japonica]|uniref:Uncharacterized protein n=1 Tax=Popillia japonica TaxID=7064 RepID=A0AAW1I8D9_POPJA